MAKVNQAFEKTFNDRYTKLNTAQRKAVDTIEGPLLVVAGPGSGKTEILSMRVAQILRQTHAMPSNILCLTFTDSASLNMRERLSRLIGERAYQVAIHTFHNFCTDIIKRHGEFFYQGASFKPADPITQIAVLESLFNNLEHDNPLRSYHPESGFVYLRAVQNAISHIKKAGLTAAELIEILEDNQKGFDSIMKTVVPALDERLSKKVFETVADIITELSDIGSKRVREKDRKINAENLARAEDDESESGVGATVGVDSIRSSQVFHSIEESVASSLADALAEARQKDETEPLSKWKQKWLAKDDSGRKVFKDMLNVDKMISFAKIYGAYQTEMHRLGYFDFDDMILDVITVLTKNARLRYEVQEQFQYLLVDEFQDTNNAQMRILSLLTNAPEHGGRPNIMVVGDDDQAIYKFQGAELSNILDFKHRYIDVGLVSMIENYRSTQHILDLAMTIMRKGEKRLENLIPELSKQLVSKKAGEKISENKNKKTDAKSGEINVSDQEDSLSKSRQLSSVTSRTFETHLHEYKYIARKINALIEEGVSPSDIAIIGRKHHNLEAVLPFLKNANIPIKYEREQDVLAEPHIREIITIGRYIASVAGAFEYQEPAESLLPAILSFSFWNIPRIDIWKISLEAKREHKTWLEIMEQYESEHIRNIARFLVDLAVDAKSMPLELMLDKIIGAHVTLAVDNERDDIDDLADMEIPGRDAIKNEIEIPVQPIDQPGGLFARHTAGYSVDYGISQQSQEFSSPFRSFYFSKQRFSHARSEYLSFLSSLRVFINAIRAFDSGSGQSNRSQYLTIADLVRFVDMYEKNNLALNDESPFVTARSAVHLMSAHKSKGLEFQVVFVLSCQDDVWASRGGGLRLPFPLNLPVEPAGDAEDDQLRLFYVAVTRAKDRLFLTAHEVKEGGKKATALRFLVGSSLSDPNIDKTVEMTEDEQALNLTIDPAELLESSGMSYHNTVFLDDENVLLRGLVEEYKLSVTHLNNYLNIPKGGPRLFFEQNLLRFPQSKSAASAYGSAIHNTLECILLRYKRDGSIMKIEEIESEFEVFLAKEKLHPADLKLYGSRGKSALRAFMASRGDTFRDTSLAELDFGREVIHISDSDLDSYSHHNSDNDNAGKIAFITGKIDKVSFTEGITSVHDYKTGRSFESFESAKGDLAVKAHHYGYQLLFYKLLMENSAHCRDILFPKFDRKDDKDKKVTLGVIEFVEPTGSDKKINCAEMDLDDESAARLKKLSLAVYARIKNLDFEIPAPIIERIEKGEFKNDIDSILAFEEFLLAE